MFFIWVIASFQIVFDDADAIKAMMVW